MTEVEDLRGTFVKVGDTIAYAATDGRSGGIRVGTVLEIIPEHPSKSGYYTVPTKLKVDVAVSSGYWAPAKPTLIQASFKRFVKIADAPPVPPVPKTRDEMAAFATAWDAKVDAFRAGP